MKTDLLQVYFALYMFMSFYAKDLFEKDVIWMGLDFTQALLSTSTESTDPVTIKR